MENHYWHFGTREGGSDTADNIDAKFFTEDYTSLVRESLQNSLDEQADENQPVIVSYRFGSMEIPSDSKFYDVEKYIEGCLVMQPNPESRIHKAYTPMISYIKKAKSSGRIAFLEVSDSNTNGMDYVDNDEECSNSRFYSFAKCVGNSSKSNATRGGSYGLGKAVFYKSSSMRTIIISTQTDDGSVAFEGVASLCTSKVDGKKYEATGYFCNNDEEKPTTEKSKIPEIFRRKECGTSIYIMGVDDKPEKQEACYDDIKKAIASDFWLSILHKKLVVKVGDTTINHDNIIEIATKYFSTEEHSPIPYIETVMYGEEGLDGFVKIEEDVRHLGKCVMYIQKDRNGSNEVLHMRKTEMLICSQPMLKGYGYYGVFICLGDEGNKILRMSEDPAHKSWNSGNCENDTDKQNARQAITSKNEFIKRSIIDSFGNQAGNTTTISDLQNYLYMNVSEKEIQDSRNAIYGIHSAKKQQEKSISQIPDLFPENLPQNKVTTTTEVNVIYVEDTSAKKDEGEEILHGGHGTGGGGGDVDHIKPIDEEVYHKDEDGEKGTFLKPIKTKACAVYTKKIDGVLYHFIRIVTENDCANLVLDVYAIGDIEDSTDDIYIDNVSIGALEGNNRISGLQAKGGERLEIRIKFEDNMSHPLSISAYELKQL